MREFVGIALLFFTSVVDAREHIKKTDIMDGMFLSDTPLCWLMAERS